MELNRELAERLLGFDWFSHCGQEITAKNAERVRTISALKKAIQSVRYENVVLDRQGDFTSALFTTCREQYNKWWNVLVDQFKAQYLPSLRDVWEKRLEPLGLNEPYVQSDLSFNALSIAVIGSYGAYLPMPGFFQEMLEIYESGHLLCGWKGPGESGVFLVY